MDNFINKKDKPFEQREKEHQMEITTDTQIVHHTSLLPDKASTTLPMTISDIVLKDYNVNTISMKYTNSFNFNKLASIYGNLNMSIGITSANKQEGKTLVASNMAVSLASGYHQTTVLVDLNFKNPELHKIFNAPLGPGVVDAMDSRIIHVNPTCFENLFLMTAGDSAEFFPGIKQTLVLREILYTLKGEFDSVILDMSSVLPISEFPVHFANEIDGLISVVDTKQTKKGELNKVYRHIDERRFVGHIFNRVNEKA